MKHTNENKYVLSLQIGSDQIPDPILEGHTIRFSIFKTLARTYATPVKVTSGTSVIYLRAAELSHVVHIQVN